MKRIVLVVLALLVASPVWAAQVSLKPYGQAHHFEDQDTALGVGVDVEVREVWQDALVYLGLEKVDSESGSLDTETLDLKAGVGYDIEVSEKVTVTPKVGYDAFFTDVEGGSSGNQDGFTLGSDVSLELAQGIDLVGGVAHTWSEDDLDLDNWSIQGGLKIAL